MGESEKNTLEAIHQAAKAEFAEKGFKSASLRNIVKTAGVTTGAFYGYYNSKAELFKALVGETYDRIMSRYRQAHEDFEKLPEEVRPLQMGKISRRCMEDLLVYCYEHIWEVQLILKCSEGTKYAFLIDEMTELETESTHEYYKTLEKLGRPSPKIDRRLEHILTTGMMNAYFEVILHEMPFEDAKIFVRELFEFHTAGWAKIMGQEIP
ncbi:MAG: TetR/AcrR family transcriptional regulator [Ruminococcus sp.]|nr:TetR/AcrR family transcriptional regulator [Ruminococcus sp.]MCM1381751.1 TetR/AcrR family transcriptional regulator [Muribaculaceae bacterium]MCM1480000.1 TetR/AcrR family transcriptional regulator [Muribaculaceae bacterium]